MTRRGLGLALGLVMLLLLLGGCQRRPATRADCEAILGRIVAIELGEMGYRDPALLEHKRRALKHRFTIDLEACVGHAISATAMSCVAKATSTEAISHRCLR